MKKTITKIIYENSVMLAVCLIMIFGGAAILDTTKTGMMISFAVLMIVGGLVIPFLTYRRKSRFGETR